MTIRVKGLDKAIRELRKKGKDAERAIIEVLEDTAASIEIDAKIDAPFAGGIDIKNKIKSQVYNKGLSWRVFVNNTRDIDAYYEFGTGVDAEQILSNPDYTKEMRDLAWEFYENGLGTLRGVPYLFPNYIKHTANLVEELRNEINKAVK